MAEPRVFTSAAQLIEAVGEELGTTDWLEVDQQRVDRFAEATGDHQWIHTDPERASGGPFGSTIAHGYLTLSLMPALTPQLMCVRGTGLAVNYGSNRVRFPAPLPVGARVRGRATIAAAVEVPDGVQVTAAVVMEREGGGKPVCVAETVTRYYL